MDENRSCNISRCFRSAAICKKKEWNPDEKQCKKCGQLLPVKDFDKTQKYKDGLKKFCRNCLSSPSEKLEKIKSRQEKLKKIREKLDNEK